MEKFLQMVDQTAEVSNTQEIKKIYSKNFSVKIGCGIFITYQGKNILLSQIQRKNLLLLIITMKWSRIRV